MNEAVYSESWNDLKISESQNKFFVNEVLEIKILGDSSMFSFALLSKTVQTRRQSASKLKFWEQISLGEFEALQRDFGRTL